MLAVAMRGRSRKNYDQAIADYDDAIRLDPGGSPVRYTGRGYAWSQKKDYEKAIADYDPKRSAWMPTTPALSTAGRGFGPRVPDARFRDGKKAVETATRACELTHGMRR